MDRPLHPTAISQPGPGAPILPSRAVRPRLFRRLASELPAALAIGIVLAVVAGCGGDPASETGSGRIPDDSPSAEQTAGEVASEAASIFDGAKLARIESAIEEAIVRYSIPGTAVAIVEGEEIVYSRGMGLRHVRRRHAVTPETLFRVGAVTRPMTATMLASLADEDRLEWADLPSYEGDADFGTEWERAFAADALTKAASASSEEGSRRSAFRLAMQNRVFGPAGMMRTAITDRLPAMSDDYATPYATDLGGEQVEAEFPEVGDSAPFDGAASTAEDLARFLILHLGGGISRDGNRVASDTNLVRARTARSKLDSEACRDRPLASRCGQAFGWHVAELGGGQQWLGADGGREGFSAAIGYLQDRGIGLVVLANLDSDLGGLAYVREVRDAFLVEVLGLAPPTDSVHFLDHQERQRRLRTLAAEVRPIAPSSVRPFLGRYADGWSVALAGDRLELRQQLRSYPIEAHARAGYLIARGSRVGSRVRFEVGPDGTGMWLTNRRGEPERYSKLD